MPNEKGFSRSHLFSSLRRDDCTRFSLSPESRIEHEGTRSCCKRQRSILGSFIHEVQRGLEHVRTAGTRSALISSPLLHERPLVSHTPSRVLHEPPVRPS